MIDGWTLIIFIVIAMILYWIIKQAVEDGMLGTLKKYDEIKGKVNDVK